MSYELMLKMDVEIGTEKHSLDVKNNECLHIKSGSCGECREEVNNSALPDNSAKENREHEAQETDRITENFYRKDKIIITFYEPKESSMHGKVYKGLK